MTQVKISRGATINLGNYESARVDLEVTSDVDKADEADNYLKRWLEDQVQKIQDAAGLPPHPAERFTGGTE